MALDTQSVYAINKKEPNKIIYPSVTNTVHYIELKDGIVTEHYIDSDKPEHSYQEVSREITADNFQFYKALSDEDYHETEKADYYYNINKVSIHGLEETATVSVKSALDILTEPFEEEELAEKKTQREQLGKEIWNKLTPTQQRRYILNQVKGLSSYQIAEIEGVSQRTIFDSLEFAKKKIEKYLKKFSKTTS